MSYSVYCSFRNKVSAALFLSPRHLLGAVLNYSVLFLLGDPGEGSVRHHRHVPAAASVVSPHPSLLLERDLGEIIPYHYPFLIAFLPDYENRV